jgi:hypothetical protein
MTPCSQRTLRTKHSRRSQRIAGKLMAYHGAPFDRSVMFCSLLRYASLLMDGSARSPIQRRITEMKHILATLLLSAFVCAPEVSAQSTVEAASTCLTDNTSGKDRKAFVKWVFIAMSKHPEIASLSAVSLEVEDESNKTVGALITRLMVDDCGKELSAMIEDQGAGSISKAFEVFGRVAMTELMTDPEVNASMSRINKYTDDAKIQKSLGRK